MTPEYLLERAAHPRASRLSVASFGDDGVSKEQALDILAREYSQAVGILKEILDVYEDVELTEQAIADEVVSHADAIRHVTRFVRVALEKEDSCI